MTHDPIVSYSERQKKVVIARNPAFRGMTKQSPEIALLPAYRRQALAMTARGMSTYLESVYKLTLFVIPAKAGIQNPWKRLDSRFHGNDKKRRLHHLWTGTN